VRCRAPRAKRSSARGWLGRLSGGPLGPPGPWAREFTLRVYVRLRFVFCESEWVFPGRLGDPYGYPRHIGLSSSTRTNDERQKKGGL
jgi:hypothetical protein